MAERREQIKAPTATPSLRSTDVNKRASDKHLSDPVMALETAAVTERLAALPLQSLLEISTSATPAIRDYCQAQNIRYEYAPPSDCSGLSGRFDLALVHDVEAIAPSQVRPCLGVLKNLLSERIWLIVEQDYCPNEEWISLGFKRDPVPDPKSSRTASFSYNLETYNHKRDWNNTRYWANPEHWDKRF